MIPPPETPNQLQSNASENARFTVARRRVLIADDNQDAADSLGTLFGLMDHDVRVVYDGAEAVEAAQSFQPELILLDIGMPGMTGYEVCREIRSQPGNDGVLIVALSGWGQEEDKVRSRQAGFNEHLVKPAEPEDLRRLLASLD